MIEKCNITTSAIFTSKSKSKSKLDSSSVASSSGKFGAKIGGVLKQSLAPHRVEAQKDEIAEIKRPSIEEAKHVEHNDLPLRKKQSASRKAMPAIRKFSISTNEPILIDRTSMIPTKETISPPKENNESLRNKNDNKVLKDEKKNKSITTLFGNKNKVNNVKDESNCDVKEDIKKIPVIKENEKPYLVKEEITKSISHSSVSQEKQHDLLDFVSDLNASCETINPNKILEEEIKLLLIKRVNLLHTH